MVATLLALAACGDGRVEEQPDPAAKPDTTLTTDLPPGRFQLPTAHTPAPDLWITLPDGYQVKVTDRGRAQGPFDEFFIVDSEDPGLKNPTDSTIVTPGFMRVYVGTMPQVGIDSATTGETKRVVIAGIPLEWKLASERLPDGRTYFQREIKTRDFFAAISPELSKPPIHLHLYIAGADTAHIAELMRSAESIGLAP